MAILDDVGIEANPAYTAVSHKYIESKDDCEYAFQCAVSNKLKWFWNSPNHALIFRIKIDGRYHGASEVMESSYRASMKIDGSRLMTTSGPIIRKYRFTSVETVDDTNAKRVKTDIKRSKDLGSICVEIVRSVRKSTAPPTIDRSGLKDFRLTVAEKALKGKAISHGTSLSRGVPAASFKHFMGTHLDTPERPLAIFNFKYRSKDALRNEMVVPRSPSPSLSIDGMSAHEVRRLARERLAEIKNESKPAIKREFNEVLDLTEDANDTPRRPLKIRRNRKGRETIDLTDD